MSNNPYIKWTEELSVGLSFLDGQHGQMLFLVNSLYEAMMNREVSGVMRKILSEVLKYTEHHFSDEENLLQQCNYPGYAAHKQRHDDMRKWTKNFVGRRLDSMDDPGRELFQYLKNWWLTHIAMMDKQYAPYVVTLGHRPTP